MADGVGMAAGTGALSGGMTGAKIGSLVPGVGTAAGAAVGAAIGGISSGMKAKKAADANNAIQAQDSQELARLAEIDRIRKSIGAGTDPLTQQQLGVNQQVGATTQGRIGRSTGGAVGDTVTGLLRAQKGTQAANNQALAGSQQRLPFFENMGQQLRTRISQRALELGLQQRDQAMAEKAAQQKAVMNNISGALGAAANAGALGGAANAGAGISAAPVTGVEEAAAGLGGQAAPEVKGFISDPSLADPTNSEYTNDGQDPVNIASPQGAPVQTGFGNLTGGTGMSAAGGQFDPSQILGPGGVPTLPAQLSTGNINVQNQAYGAANSYGAGINQAGSNIDALGAQPL